MGNERPTRTGASSGPDRQPLRITTSPAPTSLADTSPSAPPASANRLNRRASIPVDAGGGTGEATSDGVDKDKKSGTTAKQPVRRQTRRDNEDDGEEEDRDGGGGGGSGSGPGLQRSRTVYRNTNVGGQGRLHQGNVINYIYGTDPNPAQTEKQKIQEALKQLELSNERDRLISLKGERTKGTCRWILGHERFKAWTASDADQPGLWILGGPGQGKTMLSIFITEHLESSATGPDEEKPHVIFFFYHPNAGAKQLKNTRPVLQSLIFQILELQPHLAHHIVPHFEGDRQGQNTLGSFELLWKIFHKVVRDKAFQATYCVVDGLDECDAESIGYFLRRVMPLLTGEGDLRLRILFSTQDTPPLARLRELPQLSLSLDEDASIGIVEDVKLMIQARTDHLVRLGALNERQYAEVVATLLDKSQGSFLWVGLVMAELDMATTHTSVAQIIAAQPAGLYAQYNKILNHINPAMRAICASILLFIVLADTPLSIPQLAALFPESNLTEYRLRPADWEEKVRQRVSECKNLLKTINHRVQLIDPSAKDFFLSNECDLPEFRIDEQQGHFIMASGCLEYLKKLKEADMHCQPGGIDDRVKELTEKGYPLCSYAYFSWPMHARKAAELGVELIKFCGSLFKYPLFAIGSLPDNDTDTYFFEDKDRYKSDDEEEEQSLSSKNDDDSDEEDTLVDRNDRNVDSFSRDRRTVSVAHVAASLNLEFWMPKLLEKQVVFRNTPRVVSYIDVNFYGDTPLRTAILWNAEATVHRLLNLGIGGGVSEKNDAGDGPLHCPTNAAAVRSLLEHDANVDARQDNAAPSKQPGSRATPLMIAAGLRKLDVVEVLLEYNADVHARDRFDRTPLLWAVSNTRFAKNENAIVDTILLLLEKKATVKVSNRNKTTALHYAAWMDMKLVAKILLDHGADVNAKSEGDGGWTPLHYAESDEMAELLLKKEALIDAKSENGLTPMQMLNAPIEYLLKAKADANTVDKEGTSALAREIEQGSSSMLDVVQLLLRNRASPNVKFHGKAMTAFHVVVLTEARDTEVGKLLRLLKTEGELDINARIVGLGATALHLAASFGNFLALKHLLDLGADVNLTFGKGYTALHVAAAFFYPKCVEVLLQHKADVEALDATDYPPLFHCLTLDSPLRELLEDYLDKIGQLVTEEEWDTEDRSLTIKAFGPVGLRFGASPHTLISFDAFGSQNKATLAHYTVLQLLDSSKPSDFKKLAEIACCCIRHIQGSLLSNINSSLKVDVGKNLQAAVTPFYLLIIAYLRNRLELRHVTDILAQKKPKLNIRFTSYRTGEPTEAYTSSLGIIFTEGKISKRSKDVWSLLLENGAKADTVMMAPDAAGKPENSVLVLNVLCERVASDKDFSLELALELIRLLLRYGAMPDQRAKNGLSTGTGVLAVHRAIKPPKGRAYASVVEELLKAKWRADDETKRRELGFALTLAVDKDNLTVGPERQRIVDLLLDHGADVEGGGVGDATPFVVAVRSCGAAFQWKTTRWILDSLVKHEANINAVDKTTGKSALQYAHENKVEDAVKWLTDHGAKAKIEKQSTEVKEVTEADVVLPKSSKSTLSASGEKQTGKGRSVSPSFVPGGMSKPSTATAAGNPSSKSLSQLVGSTTPAPTGIFSFLNDSGRSENVAHGKGPDITTAPTSTFDLPSRPRPGASPQQTPGQSSSILLKAAILQGTSPSGNAKMSAGQASNLFQFSGSMRPDGTFEMPSSIFSPNLNPSPSNSVDGNEAAPPDLSTQLSGPSSSSNNGKVASVGTPRTVDSGILGPNKSSSAVPSISPSAEPSPSSPVQQPSTNTAFSKMSSWAVETEDLEDPIQEPPTKRANLVRNILSPGHRFNKGARNPSSLKFSNVTGTGSKPSTRRTSTQTQSMSTPGGNKTSKWAWNGPLDFFNTPLNSTGDDSKKPPSPSSGETSQDDD